MKKVSAVGGAFAALVLLSAPASAQVLKYGDLSPTGNYAAFLATLAGFGITPSTITFDGEAVGVLNPLFAPGVTFSTVGDVDVIANGAGPGQGNTSSSPVSSGEGLHAASNYLLDNMSASSLTISFANQLAGAGLFVIDYFNPAAGNTLTLEAFTGANGTGTSLGSFSSVAFNFQRNNSYFMGFTSAAGDIGSIVFTDVNNTTGDAMGLDDVTLAVPVQATPEPASVLLMATGLGALAFFRRKRKTA